MKKKRLKKVLSGTLAVMLCVTLNINPVMTLGVALLDTGIIDRASNLGKNVSRMIYGYATEAFAADPVTSLIPEVPGAVETVNACDCPDYTNTLDAINRNVKIIREYSEDTYNVVDHMDGTLDNIDSNVTAILGVCKDINKNIEYIQDQLGYDPTAQYGTKNVKESLDALSHKYRVANVHSLNNEFGGSLWRPYADEVDNLEVFTEISGAFANVYMGYWDMGVNEIDYNALPESRSLQVLGADAILRTEGITPIATVVKESDSAQDYYQFVSKVSYQESNEEYVVNSGLVETAPGQSGLNTSAAVVYYDDQGNLTSDATASHAVPTATLLSLTQQTIPAVDITWLDAVTVLYKALDADVTTLQGYYSINPDITTETSPLSKELNGVTELDGYDYYIYATRANPISYKMQGSNVLLSYNYIYWKKAANEGFVNATDRDKVISAVDFYTLAKKMMIAYGEEELTDTEIQTLLKVYGSYYPVQLGETVADSWAYLKAKGILADGTEPEGYECSLTRAQLLDMCARIKDKSYRATYKNINLTITLDDMVLDRGFYPYYDFKISNSESTYVTTTIDYTSASHYTYLLPQTTEVNLGYSGAGFLFSSKDSKTTDGLIPNAIYNGMVELDLEGNNAKHYYYVVQIPKDYDGQIFLRFINTLNPGSENGTVDAIEINPECKGGGIYTQYSISDKIATTVAPQPGVNYYSFAEFPNNEDMLWYVDYVRANIDKPTSKEVASNASPLQKFASAVDRWTSPMQVMAAEDNNGGTDPKTTKTVTVGKVSDPGLSRMGGSEFKLSNAKGVFYQTSKFSVDNQTYEYTSNGVEVWKMIKGHPVFAAVAKASIATRLDYADIKKEYGNNQHASVTKFSSNKSDLEYIIDNHEKIINNAGYVPFVNYNGSLTTDCFYSLYFTDAAKLPLYGEKNAEVTDKGLISSLYSGYNSNSKAKEITSKLGSIIDAHSDLRVIGFNVDSGGNVDFEVTGATDGVDAFIDYLEQLLHEDSSIYSSIGEGGNIEYSVDDTLETSILMSRDKQYMVSWDTLVDFGIARSTEADGDPVLDADQQIYEFYTSNGVVRVDDINHIIQIGTQIYVFDYNNGEEAPSLVIVDENQNKYFDIRCITGISNKSGYTLDAGKAQQTEMQIGTGKNAIICLTPTSNFDEGTMRMTSVDCTTYGDYYKVNTNKVSTYGSSDINLITSTQYDGLQSGDGSFTYWDGKNSKDARMPLSTILPTANWMFVTSDDGVEFGGRLYVFYLKKAFEEGFANEVGEYNDASSLMKIGSPGQEFIDEWNQQLTDGLERLEVNYPNNNFEDTFNRAYEEDIGNWYIDMTKAALANLYADTGEFWTSEAYVVRCFDYTNASASNCSRTQKLGDATEIPANNGNDPGAMYFLDFLGFVYNLPSVEEFTLEKYYKGEYPLPLAFDGSRTVINYNLNYYGQDTADNFIPLGYDLTEYGFTHYSVKSKTETKDAGANITDVKYEKPDDASTIGPSPFKFDGNSPIAAPAGIFARYGLFRNTDYDYNLSEISKANTDINDYFWGTRRVVMSNDFQATEAGYRNWEIGAKNYYPVAMSAKTTAMFVNKYLPSVGSGRSCYIIQTNDMVETNLLSSEITNVFGLATGEPEWSGRVSLINFLNMIDKGSNWIIWVALTLAPMICVILMTILIGMSFMTENKIWLYFCDRFFDPVKIFTFGARDSHHWHWRKVLLPCLITYIAFALLCNANILKIIIWVVDAWMRLMQAI